MSRKPKRSFWQGLLILLIVGGSYLFKTLDGPGSTSSTAEGPSSSPSATNSKSEGIRLGDGDARIARAFREQRSGVLAEGTATVERLLPDDIEPPRHQRMILRLGNGMTVLVAHNIDLAPRVPVNEGDVVSYRGEYEWNAKGGVIHWTHHDPRGRHPAGWIEFEGKTYQ